MNGGNLRQITFNQQSVVNLLQSFNLNLNYFNIWFNYMLSWLIN